MQAPVQKGPIWARSRRNEFVEKELDRAARGLPDSRSAAACGGFAATVLPKRNIAE